VYVDTSIEGDAAASIDSGIYDASHRIISLSEEKEGLVGVWDIVIDAQGTSDVDDMHLSKGILYHVSPNPFQDKVVVSYGVFKSGTVSIEIVDTQGRIVDRLVEKNMKAEKYETTWEPNASLPKGYYYCVLKLNDIQVHSLKILRK
jgi:hypothetical protein